MTFDELKLEKLAKDSFPMLEGCNLQKIINTSASWDVAERIKALNQMYIETFKLGYRVKENEKECQKNLKKLQKSLKRD
ncbi:MAG: hypothetical protein MJ174_07360 [Treponema sp.]|nr:hypothetical protein [Treponema sp.]